MKETRACPQYSEAIVALVMGELEGQAAQELEQHLLVCDGCRSVRDALAAEEVSVRSGFEELARHLEPAERTVLERMQDRSPQRRVAGAKPRGSLLQGIKTMFTAHKRMSVAATVVLALLGGLAMYVLVQSPSVAYALEQTVAANRKIVNYHVKVTQVTEIPARAATQPGPEGLREAWAQVDERGNLVRMRLDCPQTQDGPKIIWWSEGKANVWLKAKNIYLTVSDPQLAHKVEEMRALFDPKFLIDYLQEAQKAGKVQIEIKEPKSKDQPVEMTVTSKDTPNRRKVLLVNGRSKLVEQVVQYERGQDGDWQKVSASDYLDYEKPIPAEIWQPDLPEDVTKIDQTAQVIGLPQGKLSADDIAAKVAREFFEALIAEDYAKAGQLYEGIPAAKMKEGFGKVKFIRIIQVGEPTLHPRPETRFLQVPITVEFQDENGKTVTREFTPNVRPAYNQPDRWIIGGGI